MKKALIAYALCQLFAAGAANAATIVDTGDGNFDPNVSTTLGITQWLAGEFSLGTATTITDVLGWIRTGSGTGTATAAIYTDGGDVPGSELFSAEFTVDPVDGWYGASGLSWLLDSGTYWVAYEVRAGQTFFGSMPPYSTPSPSALIKQAATLNYVYTAFDGPTNYGVRILGEQEVPEPASVGLIGIGLAGLSMSRRRKI